jgi:hypothetical protein
MTLVSHAIAQNGGQGTQGSQTQAAFRFALMQDHIRELGVAHGISEDVKAQQAAARNSGAPPSDGQATYAAVVTRKAQSIETSIATLKAIDLGPPDQRLIQGLIQLYAQDEAFYREVAGIFDFEIKNPGSQSPNAKNMEHDTGMILQIDHAIWNATPVLFSMLVNKQASAAPHKGRLQITRAQREQLIAQIDQAIGPNPDLADPTSVPAAGAYLKSNLQDDYLASDE